jgi:lipoprotein signal peptidase
MPKIFNKIISALYYNHRYYLMIVILVIISIAINYGISKSTLFNINNLYTFGLQISTLSLAVVVIFVIFGLYITNCYQQYLAPSTLITIGILSNFFEKLIFNGVIDYIQFFNSYINLADMMIWTGIFWLNFVIWFPSRKKVKNILSKTENAI